MTTINLDDDVAGEVAKLRRERGLRVRPPSTRLACAGFQSTPPELRYEQVSHDMAAMVDLFNLAGVLELEEAKPDSGLQLINEAARS